MDLAEVRVLETNELVQTYDLTDEQDRDGVTRAIYSGLDVTQQCVIRVQRDEAMGPLTTPNPTPEPETEPQADPFTPVPEETATDPVAEEPAPDPVVDAPPQDTEPTA